MNMLRDIIEGWYHINRDRIFEETKDNPEEAHETFVRTARLVDRLGLSRLLLNCPENKLRGFEISNAAGFNKNGEIPPRFLRWLGFDRVVVGTVTADPWLGNNLPRIKRYADTDSMVNWMGLPGVGVDKVRENLGTFGDHNVPITINLMATPRKSGSAVLEDLQKTIECTRNLHGVSRYELNISCPNTHASNGKIDARSEYQSQWDSMLRVVGRTASPYQSVWVKVSPDMSRSEVRDLVQVSTDHFVNGFVTTNTTRNHDPRYITSPPNSEGNGGASGTAVYDLAKKVQLMFSEEIEAAGKSYDLIACGGIDSALHARERLNTGKNVDGIQLFTPLLFKGPSLLRELRSYRESAHRDQF